MIYPFLSAVLPELIPGKAPALTLAEFDELAAENMGAKAAAQLQQDLPVHRELRRFQDYLLYKVALIRAGRLEVNCRFEEPDEFFGEVDYTLSALAAATPAEREIMLDAVIWQKLDDLEICHEMDIVHIAVYRIKLAMLQKYAARNEQNALENFENALEKLSADYLK